MKKYLGKVKQVGLSAWGKVKNLPNSLWGFTLKHVNCVYTAVVVSLVFGLLLFFSELDHAKQVRAIEKETLVLVNDFGVAIKEHQEVIDFQEGINQRLGEANQKLGRELNQAGMLIEMQGKVIRQLVLELQKAGIIPGPPDPKRSDASLAI